MRSEIREEVEECGFAFRSGFAPKGSALDAAGEIGAPLSLDGVPDVQLLRPRDAATTTPNTYSGNYGRGEFPLHTDLAHWVVPPKFMFFRCLTTSSPIPTRIVDGWDLVRELGEHKLYRALVQPRRQLNGSRPLLRILDSRDGAPRFLRWDSLFLLPADLSHINEFEAIKNYLSTAKLTEVYLAKAGDVLVIDNWRMLHGRGEAKAGNRLIERVYLDQLVD